MAISRSSIPKEISNSLSKRKKKGRSKIPIVMKEFKAGTLNSGSKKGPKVTSRKQEVTSRKQAVAIALSAERKRKAKKKKKRK